MATNLDIQAYVPLATIINMYIDAHSKTNADFRKCWVLGFRALALMNQQFAALPKTVALPLNGNRTVDFPVDCINWSKIGLMDENGKFSSLKINRSISALRDKNPNRQNYITEQINTSLGILANAPFFFNFYGNGVYANSPLFGIGGGLQQFGECNVDEKNRVVILSPDFNYDHIIFEYISAPERDADYTVETYLQEPIIAFIEWKTGLGQRELFYAACTEARRAMPGKRVTLQQVNQIVREASGFYLKA